MAQVSSYCCATANQGPHEEKQHRLLCKMYIHIHLIRLYAKILSKYGHKPTYDEYKFAYTFAGLLSIYKNDIPTNALDKYRTNMELFAI